MNSRPIPTLKFCMSFLVVFVMLIGSFPVHGDMTAVMTRIPDPITTVFPSPGDCDIWWRLGYEFIPAATDGYGIVYYKFGAGGQVIGPNETFRSPTSDPIVFLLAQATIWTPANQGYLFMGHARSSTAPPYGVPDPHPFVWNDGVGRSHTFQHNGTLNTQRLIDITNEMWAPWNGGTTWSATYGTPVNDSEAYFHWIMCNIRLANNNVETGLQRALIALKDWDAYRNFILSDAIHLYAFKGFANLNDPNNNYHLGYYNLPNYYGVSSGPDGNPIGYGTQLNNREMVKMRINAGITNYANYDQPVHRTLPYSNNFENSYDAINKYWYLSSWDENNQYGRIRIYDDDGNKILLLDSNTDNNYALNKALLHLDLTGDERVHMDFSWKHFRDEEHDQDGVFLSDDGGATYTLVYQCDPDLIPYDTWLDVHLDIDYLCQVHGLNKNNQFIIKFQQYDNYSAETDGIGFDNISIFEAYTDPDGYDTGFETGTFDVYWGTPLFTHSHSRVQVTDQNGPYEGTYHLTMDSTTSNVYADNAYNLYVDFSKRGRTNYTLDFYVKDFGDENHSQDGIYFSDDNGQTFTLVYQFLPQSWPDQQWQHIELDVGSLLTQYGLSWSDRFVIKFRQYDNYPIPTDGMAFDYVRLIGTGGYIPNPTIKD